jgi:uncharacterized MAPEG superfamily protein
MSPELKWLAYSILLGLVHVFVAAGFATGLRGLRWNAGNRDGDARPLTPAAARAARANANFQETFPLFAAAVLGLCIAGRHTPHTVLAAQLYFWARFLYLPIYIAGIAYVRTVVWAVSLWGLLQAVEALL